MKFRRKGGREEWQGFLQIEVNPLSKKIKKTVSSPSTGVILNEIADNEIYR